MKSVSPDVSTILQDEISNKLSKLEYNDSEFKDIEQSLKSKNLSDRNLESIIY